MYQVIDEQDEEDFAQPRSWSVLPYIIGAVLAGLVFFVVWLFSPGQQTEPGQIVDTPASRASYLVALSERNPAVRRARLMDYNRTHPDTDRKGAIESQLDVINRAELTDWEKLSDAVYSETLKVDEKWSEMADYEMRWNGSLLGGRGEELGALKQVLDTAKRIDDLPDRTLDPGKSPIPENIPSDKLAGAPPQMAVTFPIPEPEPEPQVIVIEDKGPKDIIVMPTVRRNVSPNYPRKARKNKVSAVIVISMDINEKGKVKEAEAVEVQAEQYEKDFVKAARRAAKRTRFHPKTINGEPVPARDVRKRYVFRSNE